MSISGSLSGISFSGISSGLDTTSIIQKLVALESAPIATYQAHLTSRTQDSSPDDPPSSDQTMIAKYLGPCKSDQQPGDIIMMGGMKINIKDIIKMREQRSDAAATN